MGKVAFTVLVLTCALGCASPRVNVYVSDAHGAGANLLLAHNPDDAYLAELHAQRSAWPAVARGYVFEDVSTYSEVIYDDQSFYMPGRYGGGYIHESVSVRSGLMVR